MSAMTPNPDNLPNFSRQNSTTNPSSQSQPAQPLPGQPNMPHL